MDDNIKKFLPNISFDEPLAPATFEQVLSSIPITLPQDYLDYMRQYNGGEGFVGEDGRYARFWPLQELLEANEDYLVKDFAPGIFLIGSDGGGNLFGIKKSSGAFIEVHSIDLSDDEAIEYGQNFNEFILYLSSMA